MKKLISIGVLASTLCGLAVYAAQDVAIERVEVRDPVRLEAFLEANATDAQARIAALEGSLGTNPVLAVTVGALTTTGAVTISEGKLADSTVVSADIKDGTVAAGDLATAVTSSLAKADAALQPNDATYTNTIIGVGNITNTIIVRFGQITSWTQAGP